MPRRAPRPVRSRSEAKARPAPVPAPLDPAIEALARLLGEQLAKEAAEATNS